MHGHVKILLKHIINKKFYIQTSTVIIQFSSRFRIYGTVYLTLLQSTASHQCCYCSMCGYTVYMIYYNTRAIVRRNNVIFSTIAVS